MAIEKVESYRDNVTNKFVTKEKGRAAFESSINLPTITTGSSLMNMSGGAAMQMSPMESMMEVFLEIRDNTKETVEILKTAVMGTPQERKEERIGAGDTDKEEKRPGILSKVGTTLGKLNPFGGGGMLDTLGKLILAVGGLALLKIFGDKAVGPLSDLIKTIKEAKLADKIKEIVVGIKETFERFITGIQGIITRVKEIYTSIENFIMKYDEDDSGTLDEKELDKMVTDLTSGFVEYLKKYFKDILKFIGGVFLAPTLLGLATSMIRGKVLGTPGVGPLALGSVLGLGMIVTAGVISLIDANSRAYEDAITDEFGNKQDFDFSEYIGSFLGGNKKGGFFNAFKNLLEKAAIGGATGIGIAALVKAGIALGIPLGPIGMATGALAGLVIGGIIGFVTGLIGADAIGKFVKGIGADMKFAMKTIGDFFGNLISGVTSLFKGDTFAEGFHGNKLKKQKAELAILESQYELMDPDSATAQKFLTETLQPKRDFVETLETNVKKMGELAAEPENIQADRAAVVHYEQENSGIQTQIDMRMAAVEGAHTGSQMYIDAVNYKTEMEKVIAENEIKKAMAQQKIDMFTSVDRPQQLTTDFKNKSLELNVPVGDLVGSSRQGGMIVANNKTNSDNSKIEQHQHGSLTIGNPHSITQALAHNKMINMRGVG